MNKRPTGAGQKYECLLLIRVSTTKQVQESDSPEHQLRRGLSTAEKRFGIPADAVFVLNESWSGRDEDRPRLDQAFEIAQLYGITKLLFFDIDRLTRAGPAQYELIKRKFRTIDCDIVDVKGIIQPESNTLEGTGGSFGGDFTYDWSVFSASEKAEVMEAQMAKDEARKILARTVPAQIRNVQEGRTNRWAPYGYRNCRIVDDTGRPQPSLEIDKSQAWFVRKLFEMVAAGDDIRRVCDELNRLGFQTRTFKRWNADHSQVVGTRGGLPLDPRRARDMIARPIYAGFVCEKWTHGMPVPANHEGIVSRERWNQANRGRWMLVPDEQGPTGWERLDLLRTPDRRSYQRSREDFPFKSLIRCQTCGKPLKAGYSRSRNGDRYGYYQCARGHKQISCRQDGLHEILRDWLSELKFTEPLATRFEHHIREVWVEKVGGLNRRLADANRELADLRDQADGIFEKIKIVQSPLALDRLEKEFDALEQRIKLLEANRDHDEFGEGRRKRAIKWARHLVEHLDELILDTDDNGLRGIFWNLVFCTTPTLDEIKNRTAEISPLVRVKGGLDAKNGSLVGPGVSGLNQITAELERWAKTFAEFSDVIGRLFPEIPDDNAEDLPKAA